MKNYIYPENLRANVKLWFWSVRDFIIICDGIILSVIVLVNLWNVLPFAFFSLRGDETAMMDYIFNAAKFFLTSQVGSTLKNAISTLSVFTPKRVKRSRPIKP